MNLDIEKFIDGLHDYLLKEVVQPTTKRFKALESRVDALEKENATLRERAAKLEGKKEARK